MLTEDWKSAEEVNRRIAVRMEAFTKKKTLFRNKNLDLKLRRRLGTCCVWNILLYGCEI